MIPLSPKPGTTSEAQQNLIMDCRADHSTPLSPKAGATSEAQQNLIMDCRADHSTPLSPKAGATSEAQQDLMDCRAAHSTPLLPKAGVISEAHQKVIMDRPTAQSSSTFTPQERRSPSEAVSGPVASLTTVSIPSLL